MRAITIAHRCMNSSIMAITTTTITMARTTAAGMGTTMASTSTSTRKRFFRCDFGSIRGSHKAVIASKALSQTYRLVVGVELLTNTSGWRTGQYRPYGWSTGQYRPYNNPLKKLQLTIYLRAGALRGRLRSYAVETVPVHAFDTWQVRL